MDRRALIVGSWLSQGREPSHQRVRGLLDRWRKALAIDGDYPFSSLSNMNAAAEPITNPKISEITASISDDANGLTSETELLIYFVGHTLSVGNDDLHLLLRTDDSGDSRRLSLRYLISTIKETTPICKIVMILDTCHSGCAKGLLRNFKDDIFAMFASGSEFAFGANFSDNLLKSLETPIGRNDQRVDVHRGGVTYRKLFEDARGRLLKSSMQSEYFQQPECFGDYGGSILRSLAIRVPQEYNGLAPRRSIYGRLHYLLLSIREAPILASDAQEKFGQAPLFVVKKGGVNGEGPRFVSRERLSSYFKLLRRIEWIYCKKGTITITNAGIRACDDMFFNELLLLTIEKNLFKPDASFSFLDDVIKELIADMLPPTPSKIQRRSAMKGVQLSLTADMRLALQILPMSGRYMKGSSDALYPAEYDLD